MRTLAMTCALAVAVSGCATSSKDVPTAYVSPLQYQGYDCMQLAAESQRIGQRAQQLGGRLDQSASNDAALVGVGMVLFWPALFFLGGTKAQEAEYARLKGEADAIQQAGIAHKCPMMAAAPREAPSVKPAAVGSPPLPRELVGCVPMGTREGQRVNTRDHGQVEVTKISPVNTHCGANGTTIGTITATFVPVAVTPASPRAAPFPASSVTVPVAASSVRSTEERLRELKRLRDESLITQDMYDSKVKDILANH